MSHRPALFEAEVRRLAMDRARGNMFLPRTRAGTVMPNAHQLDHRVDHTIQLLKEFAAKVLSNHRTVLPAYAPPKGLDRAEAKVREDYQGDWYSLLDAARMTLLVRSVFELDAVVATVTRLASAFGEVGSCNAAEGYRLIKRKVQHAADSPCGYSDANMVLQMRNGRPAEIQVNTAPLVYGKFPESIFKGLVGANQFARTKTALGIQGGLGHRLYEIWRINLDPRNGDKLEAARLSRDYYAYLRAGILRPTVANSIIQEHDHFIKSMRSNPRYHNIIH